MRSACKILDLQSVMEDELPWLEQFDVPIIANVAGTETAEYVEVAKQYRKRQMLKRLN